MPRKNRVYYILFKTKNWGDIEPSFFDDNIITAIHDKAYIFLQRACDWVDVGLKVKPFRLFGRQDLCLRKKSQFYRRRLLLLLLEY